MKEEVKSVRDILAILLVAGTCAGVFLSCSEDPNESNYLVATLPFSGFAVRETTLQASSSKFQRLYSPMDGKLNLVGRNGTYQAYSILQYYPSYFPARDTITVVSAKLTVRFVTWAGAPGGQLSFTVYRVLRSWGSTTTTWDSVQSGFYETIPRGTFSVTTAADSFDAVIPLDTAMVRQWFATSTSTTDTKYGIILVPDAATQNSVRGMYEFGAGDTSDHSPTLTVIAGNSAGTPIDTSTFRSGQDTFVATDDHSGADPGLLFIQAGVNYRAALTFDISGIPRGAIMNRAILTMEQDPAASIVSKFAGDTAVSAHALLTDSSLSTGFSIEDQASFGRRTPGTPAGYTFDIRTIAQSWLRGPNYGVLLRFPGAHEYSSSELLAFYGATGSDPLKRPKLRILYSIPAR